MFVRQVGLVLVAFASVAATHPANHKQQVAREIIKHLDLTSFHNSVRPRREPGKKSFADYGFTRVRTTPGGAELTEADGGWGMGINVLRETPSTIIICFTDYALQGPGDSFGPTYDAQSHLSVSRNGGRWWKASELANGNKSCPNNPPQD